MIIGIDPGVKGGMALVDGDGALDATFAFTDRTEAEIEAKIGEWLRKCWPFTPVSYLEKVNTRPGEGHVGAFTFGCAYGFMRGLMVGKGIKVVNVYPAIWQARLGCLTHGNKNVSKNAAQRLFPGHKITHCVADAALIATYGHYMETVDAPVLFSKA